MEKGTNGTPGAAIVVPFTNRTPGAPCGPRPPSFFHWRDFKDWVVSMINRFIVDLTTKADKVSDGTTGNLVGIGDNGSLVDSGLRANGLQPLLTFDTTPTAGSLNPVTSGGIKQAIEAAKPSDYEQVKEQVTQNTDNIIAIKGKIPSDASARNQLADKAFVADSVATNSATFRGSYNAYSELSVSPPYPLTPQGEVAIATAIVAKLASLVPPVVPENNDYCFVQIPRNTQDPDDFDPTVIDRIDRYKCTVENGVSSWDYEWSLNNSSFTADQWAAINSGITSALVTKLGALPTAQELAAALLAKYEKPNTGIPKTDLAAGVQASLDKADTALQTAPVQSVNGSTGVVQLGAGDVGALSTEDGGVVRGNVAFGGGLVIGSTAVPSGLQGGEVRVTFIRSDYSGCVLVAPNGKVVVGGVGAISVSACSYEGLPHASSNSFGIVKIGSNINVNGNGVISIPFADNFTAGVIKMDGSSDAPLYLNASSQITARVAGSSNLGIVKGGGNVKIDSIGTMSVPDASTDAAGVVLLADTPINCSCSYANSSGAHIEAVTPYGFSLGLRYMIPYRGSSGGYDTHDRQIRHLNRSEVELAEQASIPLPQQGDLNAARDFIVDVDYRTDDSSATAHTLRLGSNYGTAWHVCVAEGEDLTDMLTFNPGEVARLYFTETALHVGSSGDRAPVFLVARQNVEMAEVNNG